MISFKQLLDDDQTTKISPMKNKKSGSFKKNIPWIDKYRPSNLNEVVYQDEVIKVLKKTLETGNLPHLLFYGPPGTGKTSSILAITKELFGPKLIKERVIELNASDERGINVVRNKIVTFSKTAIGPKDPKFPCPPYKIIILDEADAMTTEAQSALRKTMEDNSHITRFCFICNYINQIIDPINSRCVSFRFKPLSIKSMINKLKYIAEKEELELSNEGIEEVALISKGDMRRAIMLLQNLKYNYKLNKKISLEDINEVAGHIPTYVIDTIYNMCLNKTVKIENIVDLTNQVKSGGYQIYGVINQLSRKIITSIIIDDQMKSIIFMHLSTTERRLIEGADEYLQLLSLLMCIRSVVFNIPSIHSTNFLYNEKIDS